MNRQERCTKLLTTINFYNYLEGLSFCLLYRLKNSPPGMFKWSKYQLSKKL